MPFATPPQLPDDCADSQDLGPQAAGLDRARLEGVLRAASSVSIIVTDLAGTIRLFNSGAERILGYGAAEVLGRMTPRPFHLAAEMDAYGRELGGRLGRPVKGFEVFVILVREGGPAGSDTRQWTYVRKDGGHVPVELTVTGVYSAEGRLEGFLGVAQDLSGRRTLEASLRQAQVCVDSAGDMILWAGVDDARLVYANKAACEALGYRREELLGGMRVLDLNPTRNLENWRAHGGNVRRQGRVLLETVFRRRDGLVFPVESISSLVEHGGETFVLGIIRDISERRALLAELHQAQVSVDNAQDMILWMRLDDGRVAFANAAACRTLGYAPEELIGLDSAVINPAVAQAEGGRQTCAVLRNVDRSRFEAVFRSRDGRALPVEASATRVRHEGVDYAVGIVRDISERKAAEARLEAEMRLTRSLAESARALLGADPDMNAIARILLDRACELTGSRHGYVAFIDQAGHGGHPNVMSATLRSEGCAMGALPVTGPPGPDGLYPGLWGHSLNTRQGFYANDPARHPSARGLPEGHMPIARLLSAPAVSKGRIVGQIALANPPRDYTRDDLAAVESLADVFALGAEQVLSQRALRAAKDAAEASSRAKSAFLSNMTHEVRTPLNGILGMIQVLLAGSLSQEQRDYAGVALESADRLHRLLDNVIEYARLDGDLTPADCLSFPPLDLLRSLEALYTSKAVAGGLVFSVRAEPGLPELMLSDPQSVQRILGHLLDNAIKFTPAGAVELTAGPAAEDSGRIVFRVSDTGIGIPAEKRAQVFEAFAQADAGITRTYGGAGLGLAIARRLAERLGGALAAADRPGGGTVMTLTLPRDCTPILAA
jgi:PAS domain S-box-containing protein